MHNFCCCAAPVFQSTVCFRGLNQTANFRNGGRVAKNYMTHVKVERNYSRTIAKATATNAAFF